MSPLPQWLSAAEAVNRVGIAGYGDHWVARIERTHYAILQYIMVVSWLKRHGFDTEAGAVNRERLEAILTAHPPNWKIYERRLPDFKVGPEHTVFEWCMFYICTKPNLVHISEGTTVDDMNTRLRAIGALPAPNFKFPNLRLQSAPEPGNHRNPRSHICNEVFQTIHAEIRADRLIPLKLAYCSDQPARLDPTMCVIRIEPVLEIAQRRGDFGPTMAGLLAAHPDFSSERTGAPGRPSKGIHIIKAEFDRRIRDNLLRPSLREEATDLRSWYLRKHPSKPLPGLSTIENHIRSSYWQAKTNKRSEEG